MGHKIINDQKTHPSYGMVSFSRINGGNQNFFGSHMKSGNWIELRIKEGSVSHDLGKNWYFAGKEIISVRITHSQFVNLITNMNQNNGSPCTIEHIQGKTVDPLPEDEKTEAQKAILSFEERMGDFSKTLKNYKDKVTQVLEKPRINKGDASEIKDMLHYIFQEVESNIPWFSEQFDKSAQKIVTQAKQEVEAFTSDIIRQAGLESIAEGNFPKMLE